MSEEERQKWEQRYRERGAWSLAEPSPLLVAWLPRLPKGRVLDLACGTGRNALYAARLGYQVDAIDISDEALRQAEQAARNEGLAVRWIKADLDRWEAPQDAYDVVVQVFYLNRALVPRIKAAVKPGGYVLVEQHLITTAPVGGPKNTEFRVRPNELLSLFRDFRVLFYEEGLFQEGETILALARMVACKGTEGF